MLISVLVASQLRRMPDGGLFVDRALESIHAQDLPMGVSVEVVVGLNPGLTYAHQDPAVRVVSSPRPLFMPVLNTAASAARGDVLAIHDDDDQWHPERLASGIALLVGGYAFVSTSAVHVDLQGRRLLINDFPLPAGWMMWRSTWERVGPLDETYRWHPDSEWLGRLTASGLSRVHQVDNSARMNAGKRLGLIQVMAKRSSIVIHPSTPLLLRTMHDEQDSVALRQNLDWPLDPGEEARMRATFGEVPC